MVHYIDEYKFREALQQLWCYDSLGSFFKIVIVSEGFDENNKRYKITFGNNHYPFKGCELTSWQRSYINKNRGYDFMRTCYYLNKEEEFEIINHLIRAEKYLEEVQLLFRAFKRQIEKLYSIQGLDDFNKECDVLIWIDTDEVTKVAQDYIDSCPYILLHTDWVEGGYKLQDKKQL